jgi:hypothetical protein
MTITSTKLYDGQSWGRWVFIQWNLTLVLTHDGIVRNTKESEKLFDLDEIDLEEMRDSAEMMDKIFQIHRKSYVTAQDMLDLLKALEYIFNPQANLCSGGQHKTIDATEHLQERLAHR